MVSGKDRLEWMLLESSGNFLSGEAIAGELDISRTAVWKNIRLLEKDGYRIEAVNNKGYRIAEDNDVLSAVSVRFYMNDRSGQFPVEYRESVDSTNTLLKSQADHLPDWSVAAAACQTAGRGRIGRSFFSPVGSGVYISVLQRERVRLADAGMFTTAAAVAACRAIEQYTDAQPQIKWVNDVFVNGKKVCGILTEASVNYESGTPDWAVTGIGFNIYEPEGGFPPDIADIAGFITRNKKQNLRSCLAAGFVVHFRAICLALGTPSMQQELYNEYKKRCFILGRPIFVIKGEDRIPATAVDINRDFSLLVRYEDGAEETLNAGEVSIRF